MTATELIKNALVLVLLDLPWLGFTSKWVSSIVQKIQGSPLVFRTWTAIPVYLALGYLLEFAKTADQAFRLGWATYSVYDFTNYATLKRYPLQFAIADSLWGGVLMWLAFNFKQYLKL
jgi:uncharacterized membrane protein